VKKISLYTLLLRRFGTEQVKLINYPAMIPETCSWQGRRVLEQTVVIHHEDYFE